jgi:hypothetical protein
MLIQADLLSVESPSWYESDTYVVEMPSGVEVTRPVLPKPDSLAVSNLILGDSIASFAGVATALFQVFPNPEVKWVGHRNIHNSTTEHR